MPYRHAHFYVLAIFPLAGLAFWPAYLSQVTTASIEFHAHGITATLWLALLVTQSALIHGGNRPTHRALGFASLALFPLFLAGGSGIFLGMARRLAANVSPFYDLYAARLAWLDIVTVAGFAWFYHQALARRRTTPVHAGYMLATTIFLLPPILGRLAPALPPLAIAGPQDFWKLGIGFQLANAIAAAIALVVAARARGHGRPFLEAAGLTLVGALAFQFVGPLPAWRALFTQAAALPPLPFALAAAIAGCVIAYAGWRAGEDPAPRPATA
ncbi:hypothetical protein [Caulobacter hibisci]|uniref:Uncharacterized protein n=1 Tax=Caulobacter hibisci TaxID=2035993 RepID=A0ABS0STC8_9CAUL|nr:hypothetical protein [Caulobacter hibisci]MBI1682456.1 hypothetical protein [Caulobacter hibisci]